MINRVLLATTAAFAVFTACKMKKHTLTPSVSTATPEETDLYYLAESEFESGLFTESRVHFEEFVKKNPRISAGQYRLACLDRLDGKKEDALTRIRKAETLDTANIDYRAFEADLLYKMKNYQGAARAYESLAVSHPERWSFYTDAARMFKYANDAEGLVRLCKAWETAYGLREDVAVNCSDACFQLGNYAQGLQIWNQLMQRYPYRRQYKLTYATLLTKAGESDSAARVYEEMLKEDPNNPDLLSSLCTYYQNTNNLDALWIHCKLVVQSTQLDIWKKHSCMLPFMNNLSGNKYYDSLEKPLTILTQIHGDDHRSWLFLSDWYFAHKQYTSAADDFARSLSLFSSDFQVWLKYTECLDRLGRFKELTLAADSMSELFPSHPTVELIAANAFMGTGNYKTAIEHCENGLIYALDDHMQIVLKCKMASAMAFNGNVDEASELFTELSVKYPDDHDIIRERADFMNHFLNQHREAAALMKPVMDGSELAADDYVYAGILATDLSQLKEAEYFARKAVETDAQGKYRTLLGEILYLQGSVTDASAQWKLAQSEGYEGADLKNSLKKVLP